MSDAHRSFHGEMDAQEPQTATQLDKAAAVKKAQAAIRKMMDDGESWYGRMYSDSRQDRTMWKYYGFWNPDVLTIMYKLFYNLTFVRFVSYGKTITSGDPFGTDVVSNHGNQNLIHPYLPDSLYIVIDMDKLMKWASQ